MRFGLGTLRSFVTGDLATRYVTFLLRHARWVLGLTTLLAVVAGVRTAQTYANLRSELEELLPTTAPSVVALEEAKKRLPGLRHLGVVVDTGGPENAEAALRFLSDLEQRVAAYPSSLVGAVQSGVSRERAFLETYALQLADPADVRALREAVEARKRWEVGRALGTQLLDEEEDPPPEIPLRELLDKYTSAHGRSFPDDRFLSEDRRTAVLVIQTGSQATSIDADEELLGRVKADADALGFPAAYASQLRLGFAGDVATRVEEARGLAVDLGISGTLVMVLVFAALALFFGTATAWPVLIVPVVFGTLYAFGVVALPPLAIRHLNTNTAFLSSIIVGNGINAGVILLARFQEQAKTGSSLEVSLATAVRETAWPTLAAALAAAGAYASLTLTDFRGFRQFGWLGGIGLVMTWAVTFVVAPVLTRTFATRLTRGATLRGPQISASVARFVMGRPRLVLAAVGALVAVSLLGMARRHSDWLETDFSRLRRADSFESGERYWGKRMDATLQRYLTPTVIMTGSAEEARKVATAMEELKKNGHAGELIANVRSIDSVLPPTRDEALREARRLKRALSDSMLAALEPADREKVLRALSDEALSPVPPEAVPTALAAGLRDKEGHLDRNVLVFPVLSPRTWEADHIGEFAHDLRVTAQAVSPTAVATGPLLLSSDIIDAMRRDGPRSTAIALGTALLVTLLAFRTVGLSVLAISSLTLGVVLMLGGAAWAGQRVNFSNLIALPITFGIAADYSINVLKRFQSGATLTEAVANTGGAVALCSVTTVIGYGSLLVAENQALFSFGALSVAGELSGLVTATLVLPAYLVWRRGTRRREPALASSHPRLGLDP